MADYTGPIKVVDIPGKGKGIVVKEDVKKGTLLLAAKAYASDFQHDASVDGLGFLGQLVIEKLEKNPQTAKDLYALKAGDLSRDVEIPFGHIDVERVEAICLNNFDNTNDSKNFLWLLPSLINHACLCKSNSILIFL